MRCFVRVATLVAILLAAATLAQAQDVTLSVAISMKDAVEELGKGFMASRPGVTLRYNFGSSGELQKQIEAGAPVDLFISAAQRQMDELEQKRLVVSATRRVFARNVLTVIKPADSKIRHRQTRRPARRTRDEDRDRQSEDGAGGPVRRGEPQGARARGPRCSPSSSSRRTCARRSTTWPAARSMRVSSTPPTPSPVASR